MEVIGVTFAFLAHTLFWGLGLAWWLTPRAWGRAWLGLVPIAGLALQSAVVWIGATATPWAGTDRYGRTALLVPGLLLALAVWRVWRQRPRSRSVTTGGPEAGRSRRRATVFILAVAAVMAASSAWLVSPLALGGYGLTTTSLGSCDHADYAAGARVLKEFSRHDRSGFIGLTEVVTVLGSDNFFDYWIRLNHFSPAALIALNASVFGLEPWQITGVVVALLPALSVPLVLLVARRSFRLPPWGALAVGTVYAISPLTSYAVYQAAAGQLFAAQGIALAFLALASAIEARRLRAGVSFLPLLLVAIWVIAGSYNFILLVAFVPALAYAGWQALRRRSPRPFGRALGWLAAALAVSFAFFPGRFGGVAERFELLSQFDFGWPVPLLTPEGWFGSVKDGELRSFEGAWRVVAAVLAAGVWAAFLVRCLMEKRRRALGLQLAAIVPAAVGYAWRAWEALEARPNASYDAYKVLGVFYPLVLAALLTALIGVAFRAAGRRIRWRGRLAAGLALAVVATANVAATAESVERMRRPPLRVRPELAALQALENDPRFASFNLRIREFWARLWANSFLLRKPQYFPTHTYEGRLNTELRGDWDLRDSFVRVVSFTGEEGVLLNETYFLTRADPPPTVTATLSGGWHALEHSRQARWRWSDGTGVIDFVNRGEPVRAVLRLRLRLPVAGEVRVAVGETEVAALSVGNVPEEETISFVLPPGNSTLRLLAAAGAQRVGSDPRPLAVAVYGAELMLR